MADDRTGVDPEPDPEAYPDCPVVDAHVHVLETGLLEAIVGWFDRETEWTMPAPAVETLVDRIVARTDGFVFFPYAHKPGIAREMNASAAGWQARLDDPVYERLVAADLPLVIHASSHPFYRGSDILGPAHLERVFERFPDLRVCVPHFGLFETDGFLALADEYEVYFDTAVSTGARTHEEIGLREGELDVDRLREHSDRVMFGTDYPLRPLPFEEELRGTRELFPDATADVFYRNAAEFFGLDLDRP
jgi:predicted TIM-barrel fold metal-dependent hydrolase